MHLSFCNRAMNIVPHSQCYQLHVLLLFIKARRIHLTTSRLLLKESTLPAPRSNTSSPGGTTWIQMMKTVGGSDENPPLVVLVAAGAIVKTSNQEREREREKQEQNVVWNGQAALFYESSASDLLLPKHSRRIESKWAKMYARRVPFEICTRVG